MVHLIRFTTSRFDTRDEAPNPINPIAGQSVLAWLRTPLADAGYQSTEPDTEDWGWYMDVQSASGSYMVGASGEPEADNAVVEWAVQIHKHRTLTDKLLGRNVMSEDDPLVSLIERTFRSDSEIADVTVERGD